MRTTKLALDTRIQRIVDLMLAALSPRLQATSELSGLFWCLEVDHDEVGGVWRVGVA